jgi:hypothetical protein
MSTLALHGRIAELKKKSNDIGVKVRALVRSINAMCIESLARDPGDMDADAIASLAGSLAEQRREYRETLDMIKELEREL